MSGYIPVSSRRAIVIGAGIAGLLATRVLADHFETVFLIERDTLPDAPTPRKGVPQARYVHQLLMRGRLALEALFPGLEKEILAAHAAPLDWYSDVHWFGPKGWMARSERGFETWSTSRDLLEFILRQRVLARSEVKLLAAREVAGLITDAQTQAVTGVRIRTHDDAHIDTFGASELMADLVVDASGRASHLPAWLQAIGYDAPQETLVNAFVGYASRIYRRPPTRTAPPWKALVIHSCPPTCVRSGTIFPIEGERWIVTLTGAARDYPTTDETQFIEFARSLRSRALYDAIVDAQPLSDIYNYRRTENRLRHYERMSRWPPGLAVLGDAVCGFNPVYGQGMTVAAIEAQLLDAHLKTVATGPLHMHAFEQRIAAANTVPWTLATGVDYRYESTQGPPRGWRTRIIQRYMDYVMQLACEHQDIYRQLVQVMHMVAPPATLFAPPIATRVTLCWARSHARLNPKTPSPAF